MLVERHCDSLKDFTGERPNPIALDIGCAVGGATFHLSKCGFAAVLGLDYSHAFINAANVLKKDGMITYRTVVEGKLTVCCCSPLGYPCMEQCYFRQLWPRPLAQLVCHI